MALRSVGLLISAKPQIPYVVRWYRTPASRPSPGGSSSASSRLAMIISSCSPVTCCSGRFRSSSRSPVPRRQVEAVNPRSRPSRVSNCALIGARNTEVTIPSFDGATAGRARWPKVSTAGHNAPVGGHPSLHTVDDLPSRTGYVRRTSVTRTRRTGGAPSVAVIGAGLGGIGLAIRLKQAGFRDLALFEKEEDVGGPGRAETHHDAARSAWPHPGQDLSMPAASGSPRSEPQTEPRSGLRTGLRTARRSGPLADGRDVAREFAARFGVLAHIRFGAE